MNEHHESLDRLIDERLAAGCTPEEAAAWAVAHLDAGDLIGVLHPLALARAKMRARAKTRRVEQAAASGSPDARRRLVSEKFALPDTGEWVSWGEATSEQHRARAGWLRDHADRTLATATRHEQAADDIDAAGVTCLNDLIDGAA